MSISSPTVAPAEASRGDAKPFSAVLDRLTAAGLPTLISRHVWDDPETPGGAAGALQANTADDFRAWRDRLDDARSLAGVDVMWVGPESFEVVIGSLRSERANRGGIGFPVSLWRRTNVVRTLAEANPSFDTPLVFEPTPTELVTPDQLAIAPPDEPFDDDPWIEALNALHRSANEAVSDSSVVPGPPEEDWTHPTEKAPAQVALEVTQTPAGSEEAAGEPTEADR